LKKLLPPNGVMQSPDRPHTEGEIEINMHRHRWQQQQRLSTLLLALRLLHVCAVACVFLALMIY
jgi:hypothetical protein